MRQGVVWVLNLSAGGKTPQEGSSLAKSLWRASQQKVEEKLVLRAGKTVHELEIEKEPLLAGDLLHKMFAKKMIQELGEEPQNSQTEKELITEPSLMYNIISPFTSFISVDEGMAI